MAAWNPSAKHANVGLTGSNKIATASGTPSNTYGVRADTSYSSGKYVFAVTNVSTEILIGIMNSTPNMATDQFFGTDTNAFEMYGSGASYFFNGGGGTIGNGATYSSGNTVWVAVDITNKLIWFKFTGGNWNNSGSANPDTGVGGISFSGLTGAVFPFVGFFSNGQAATFDGTAASHGLTTFTIWDGASGYSLTANGITVSSPALGTPAIVQFHLISVGNFTTSSPVLGTPALFQNHVFAATGFDTSSPVLGTPAIEEFEADPGHVNFEADGFEVGSPVLGTPAISQVHVLGIGEFATSSPVIGSPAIVQNHVFTANNLTVSSPTFSPVFLDGTEPIHGATYYAMNTLKLRVGL